MMRLSYSWKKPEEGYLSQREKRKEKKKKNTETRIRTDGGKERPLVYLDCMIKTESG